MSTFQIDLPDQLHEQVKEFAERIGVSLNQYVEAALAEKLIRQPNSDAADMAPSQWTEEKNSRRCALIDKHIQATITDAERLELELLQRQLRQFLDEAAPYDFTTARRLHAELIQKKQKADTQR